jgi:hypothetical protein
LDFTLEGQREHVREKLHRLLYFIAAQDEFRYFFLHSSAFSAPPHAEYSWNEPLSAVIHIKSVGHAACRNPALSGPRDPRNSPRLFFSQRYTPLMRHLVDIGALAEKEVIQ